MQQILSMWAAPVAILGIVGTLAGAVKYIDMVGQRAVAEMDRKAEELARKDVCDEKHKNIDEALKSIRDDVAYLVRRAKSGKGGDYV